MLPESEEFEKELFNQFGIGGSFNFKSNKDDAFFSVLGSYYYYYGVFSVLLFDKYVFWFVLTWSSWHQPINKYVLLSYFTQMLTWLFDYVCRVSS